MTTALAPDQTISPSSPTATRPSPEQRLADRFNAIDSLFIAPATAELEKVFAYCVEEADVDEIPLTGLNPNDFGADIALARRETEIANELREFITTMQGEYARIRENALRPLPAVSRQEQFSAMLAQARETDFGDRQEFRFSAENAVTIDTAMVHEGEGFYRALVQAFVEEWEREIDGVWAAARAAGRPAPDPAQLPTVRLEMRPSFVFFTTLPSLPLNRTDALTLVAIGLVLGLWECYPGPGDAAPENMPAADLPIVLALPQLLGAAAAVRAQQGQRTNRTGAL